MTPKEKIQCYLNEKFRLLRTGVKVKSDIEKNSKLTKREHKRGGDKRAVK
jgi:hypothetical protein